MITTLQVPSYRVREYAGAAAALRTANTAAIVRRKGIPHSLIRNLSLAHTVAASRLRLTGQGAHKFRCSAAEALPLIPARSTWVLFRRDLGEDVALPVD